MLFSNNSLGILFLLVAAAAAEHVGQQRQASIETTTSSAVPQYGLYNFCFPVKKSYTNPFNYTEVNVIATISTATGRVEVDGFYYQNYSRTQSNKNEILTPNGPPQWCIRYTPVTVEDHSVSVVVKDKDGTENVASTSFKVVKATDSAPGFINVADDKIHFKDNHTDLLYVPCGENVCWVKENQGTYGYDTYFGKLSKNGANYARLWLTDNGFDDLAVETANFNISLPNTWRLDYVVSLAEQVKIRLLMCTESFNCFSSVPKMPGFWDKNCYYNKKFGGILDKPEDFFTDEQAKSDYKMRLRYLVSRYGYSTSVFAWEFFNEVDLTDHYSSSNQVNWIKEMASYLRGIDVYKHLISTSFSHSDGDENVQQLPEMDFTMTHSYGATDITEQTAQYPAIKQKKYNKPSYVAEFGVQNYSNDDKTGVSLVNGLWAPLFNMGAGTCMTWWWDSWVDRIDLYSIFKGASEFISDQLVHTNSIKSWNKLEANITNSDLRVYGMSDASSECTIHTVLLNDPCYTWKNIADGKQCKEVSGAVLTIMKCHEGSVYDTTTYTQVASNEFKPLINKGLQQVTCHHGMLKISVPAFKNFVALALKTK